MKQRHLHIARSWLKRVDRKRLALSAGGGLLGLLILVQLLYPNNRLVPFMTIDGQGLGGWQKAEAARELDARYLAQKVPLYFGDSKQAYRTPGLNEIGLRVENDARLDKVKYAWWLRLVPTSLLWAHNVVRVPEAVMDRDDGKLANYLEKELGQSCNVAPKDASLTYRNDRLEVVPSENGGTCKADDVRARLAAVRPSLTQRVAVRVPMTTTAPAIKDEAAAQLANAIRQRVGGEVRVAAGSQTVALPAGQLLSWLEFAATPERTLGVTVSKARSKDFFATQLAPKVTRAAGVSKVTTMDFTEVARVDGPAGQALDMDGTLAALKALVDGTATTVKVATMVVPPKVEFTRQYSPTDTGLSALLQQYADSHPGTYGIALAELAGGKRRAAYKDNRQYHTASTYKLYVAYGTLKRVEAGSWKWSDQIQGGRTLEKCFDDMIVKSDNPCGEALLKKIGYQALTNELKAVGLTGTSFVGDEPKTTAHDLTLLLGTLEAGQLVRADSRERLLGALQRNIYRQGIPAGAGVTVADKVGFLASYLHDAAIVYGPNGPMVLTVMTEGSSWATIADLTRQIQALRGR